MTRPQAVLFDLGNVLVRFRPQAFPERLGLDAISSGMHYGESVRRIVREYESGSMGTSEFLAGLGRMFGGRYTEQQLLDALQSVLDVPIPGMENLVGRIARQVPLGLVSNTNELHFERMRGELPVLRHFRNFFLSYRLKALKPDPAFYSAVLQRLSVPADSVVFIDDLAENIAGAQHAGIHGVLFTGAEALEEHLKQMLDF